jgi:hypothetical protein
MASWLRIIAGAALLLPVPQAIALELPAPELTALFPPEQGEVQAPISEITLIFARSVDLVEVVVITPDQQRLVLHDAFNGSEERKGDSFTLSLPQPVSMEGVYLIEYSASVTDPSDRSSSATSSYSSFVVSTSVADPGADPGA